MVVMARRRNKSGSLYAGLTGKAVFIPLEAVPPRAQGALKAYGQLIEGFVQGPDSVHSGCVVVKLRAKGPGPGAPPLKLFFRADLVESWLEPCDNQTKEDLKIPNKRQLDAQLEQGAGKKARHTTPCARMQHYESCSTPPSSTAELPAPVSQAEEADSDSTVHEAQQHVQSSAPSPVATGLNPSAPANQLLHRQSSTLQSYEECSASFQRPEIDAQQMDGLEGPGPCVDLATASDPREIDACAHVLPQTAVLTSQQRVSDVPSSTFMQFSSNLVRRFVLGAGPECAFAYSTMPAQKAAALIAGDANEPVKPPAANNMQCLQTQQPSMAPNPPQSVGFNILREAMRQPAKPSKATENKEHVMRHSAPSYTVKGMKLQPIAITRQASLPGTSPTDSLITPIAVTASTMKAAQASTHQQPVAATAGRVDEAAGPAKSHEKSHLQALQRYQQNKKQQEGSKGKQQGSGASQRPAAVSDEATQDADISLKSSKSAETRTDKQAYEDDGQPSRHKISKSEPTAEVDAGIQKWGKPSKGYTRKSQVADIIGKLTTNPEQGIVVEVTAVLNNQNINPDLRIAVEVTADPNYKPSNTERQTAVEVIYIPGPIFGVDVPDLYYRGKVIGPDPKHKDAAVVQLIEDDPDKYFFPIGQVREWVASSEMRADDDATTGVRSDEFAAQVLAAMHAGLIPSKPVSDSDDD